MPDSGRLYCDMPANQSNNVRKVCMSPAEELVAAAKSVRFGTILADPPWQFQNKTGKVAPEHKRLNRYATLSLPEIMALPIKEISAETAHLYLWVPNALLPDGHAGMGL
jgi:MT-A70